MEKHFKTKRSYNNFICFLIVNWNTLECELDIEIMMNLLNSNSIQNFKLLVNF